MLQLHENHEHEQYFFNAATVAAMADLLEPFDSICTLCAPTVGEELERRGANVTILDIDDRFARLRNYVRWDVGRPTPVGTRFSIIFCDPPFFRYSLSQLFDAIRMLACSDFSMPLAIAYLSRRSLAITSTFAPFNLQETTIQLGYRTVQKCAKNDIILFRNGVN